MKQISTLTGILIIVAAAAVLFGGVFGWEYYVNPNFTNINLNQVQSKKLKNVTVSLSEESILSAIEKLESVKLQKYNNLYRSAPEGGQGISWYSLDSITKGDINGDGLEDAFTSSTGCGASCGSAFAVILNQKDTPPKAFRVFPPYLVASGAAQYSVNNITIHNDTISIEVNIPQFDGQITKSTLNYKLTNENLEKI